MTLPKAPHKSEGYLIVRPGLCRGCRSCQLACSFAHEGEFNPNKSYIILERDLETEKTAPLIKVLGCDLCSGDPACVRACKYGALVFCQDIPDFESVKVVIEGGIR